MSFTAKDVKALRERTGVGMMECKKALTEANGDMDKAVEILREKGAAAADKKAGRVAAEGLVYAVNCEDAKAGVIVEVNSETDFVAKNDTFQDFVKTIAATILKENPADVEALKETKAVNSEETIAEMLREKVLTIGENLQIRRFERLEGITVPYIHGGGTHAVLVQFETTEDIAKKPEFEVMGKDVAMQVAAAFPLYLDEASVPAEVLEKEKEIMRAQVINEGKPEQIADKIVMGKIKKYLKENCLLDQVFVKDNDLTVDGYVKKVANELGGDIKVTKFVRYEVGEGIEKKEDNFAEEVKNMVK